MAKMNYEDRAWLYLMFGIQAVTNWIFIIYMIVN